MMWFLAFLLGLAPGSPRAGAGRSCRRPARRNPAACRLHEEPLEARCCPSASYTLTDSRITRNEAEGGAGGTAGQGVGGGLYNAGGTVDVDHTKIKHNHASTSNDDVFGSLS